MKALILVALIALPLAACGLSETTTAAATGAAAKAKEIEQGRKTMEQVKVKIEAANREAEANRQAAENK